MDAMPKQVQFTKEIIIQEAIEIIKAEGIGALTARSLSKRMGCSVAPIFHKFANMEELAVEVRKAAGRMAAGFLAGAVHYDPAFKEFGLRMVRLAKKEPKLFHYLFLDRNGSVEDVDAKAMECLSQTKSCFEVADERVLFVYAQIWPFVCGLAQLCSKKPEVYTEERISMMLSTQFQALMRLVKSDSVAVDVEPRLIPEGKNVFLRRWREVDAAALYRLANDPELGPRAGWPPHQSVEESLETIRGIFSSDTIWAVVLKESGEIVGCAGFLLAGTSNMPLGADEAEVGYWVARPYWNRGLCTEALSLVIAHCRRLGTYSTLYGEHFTDNPASGRVMEKCGFTDTGQRRTCPALEVGADKEVRVMKLAVNQE